MLEFRERSSCGLVGVIVFSSHNLVDKYAAIDRIIFGGCIHVIRPSSQLYVRSELCDA
jgi:hypothetical protein